MAADTLPRPGVIEVERVSKSFPVSHSAVSYLRHLGKPPRRAALHDVSLRVERGELLALLGPNGAGKTTLLKMIATLSVPDKGTIHINGIDAAVQPDVVRSFIGLCPSEERSFYFRLTARQNLKFFGALAGLRGAVLSRRIVETVDAVGLGEALDVRYDAFSSGMRQRLAVARALLAEPDIVLLDEPTRAIDPINAEAIRRLVKDELVTRQGKTVVLATNLLEEAWQLADRIAVISAGSISAIGSPRELDLYASGTTVVYEITVEEPGEAIGSIRAVGGVRACTAIALDAGLKLRVEIEPSSTALTELMRAASSAGLVSEFRRLDAKPAHVFQHVVNRANGRRGDGDRSS